MEANTANFETVSGTESAPQRPSQPSESSSANFARQLRALGQALEKFSFSMFDIEIENGIYVVVAKTDATERKAKFSFLRSVGELFRPSDPSRPRAGRPVDLRFTPEEIEKFDLHGKNRRQDPGKTPDPYSISQLLRGAGCYLDNRNVSERVIISFAGRWITIRYQTPDNQAAHAQHDLEYFYDCWVQMYLRRRNREQLPRPSEPTVLINWQGLRES